MKEFSVKVQQTVEGRFYASATLDTKRFIITWGYTLEEVTTAIKHSIGFRTGCKPGCLQLVYQ